MTSSLPFSGGQIHFKFKSTKAFDSVSFDGHFVSVKELRALIAEKKGLGQEAIEELTLSDPRTGQVYSDDAAQVARNASVVVKRTPGLKPNTLQAGGSTAAPQSAAAAAPAADQPAGGADAQPGAKDGDDAAFSDLYSEQPLPEAVPADDMQALLQQATDSWQKEMAESARAAFGRGRGGRFGGRGYGGRFGPGGRGAFDLAERECWRCGLKGHDARNCPTIGDPAYDKKRVRLPAGIPVEALTASGEGGLLLPDGMMGSLLPNEDAFRKEVAALAPQPAQQPGAPTLEAPAQRAAGTPALPSTSQPASQPAAEVPPPTSLPPLQLTMAPHAETGGDPPAAVPASGSGGGTGTAGIGMLPPPQLAGEEFLGLPMPFDGGPGGGLPFPAGALPEGPMGLVLQAFASDRPLTPAEYEQLKLATQANASSGRHSSKRQSRSRSPSRSKRHRRRGSRSRSPKRSRSSRSKSPRRHRSRRRGSRSRSRSPRRHRSSRRSASPARTGSGGGFGGPPPGFGPPLGPRQQVGASFPPQQRQPPRGGRPPVFQQRQLPPRQQHPTPPRGGGPAVSPGRQRSPVPKRPGSSERWEHDGGAADAAAAAARIVPPKAAADSRQRRDQNAAAQPAPDKEQPPAASSGQAQTAIQKAAARVPDHVTAALADAGSPRRQDGAAGGHGAEPLPRAGRHSRDDGGQKKSGGRHSTHQEKTDGVPGIRAEATVARSRRSVSPEGRKEVVSQEQAVGPANPEAQEQAAPRGEAAAAVVGSRPFAGDSSSAAEPAVNGAAAPSQAEDRPPPGKMPRRFVVSLEDARNSSPDSGSGGEAAGRKAKKHKKKKKHRHGKEGKDAKRHRHGRGPSPSPLPAAAARSPTPEPQPKAQSNMQRQPSLEPSPEPQRDSKRRKHSSREQPAPVAAEATAPPGRSSLSPEPQREKKRHKADKHSRAEAARQPAAAAAAGSVTAGMPVAEAADPEEASAARASVKDRLKEPAATPTMAIRANVPLFQRAMADSMREPREKSRKSKRK